VRLIVNNTLVSFNELGPQECKFLAKIFAGKGAVKQGKYPLVNLTLRISITQASDPEQSGCDTVYFMFW
jgi:hypothetical protein